MMGGSPPHSNTGVPPRETGCRSLKMGTKEQQKDQECCAQTPLLYNLVVGKGGAGHGWSQVSPGRKYGADFQFLEDPPLLQKGMAKRCLLFGALGGESLLHKKTPRERGEQVGGNSSPGRTEKRKNRVAVRSGADEGKSPNKTVQSDRGQPRSLIGGSCERGR